MEIFEQSTKKGTELEKTKLDLYLNDVYEKECLFKIGEDEVQFIQTGVEILIQNVVDLALVRFKDPADSHSANSLNEVIKVNRDDTCTSGIIKVGSFYEGTKNGFPDEFDFIFLLYSSENTCYVEFGENSIKNYSDKIENQLTDAILGLSKITEQFKDSLRYTAPDGTRRLCFDNYVYAKGPSAKLLFIYESDPCVRRDIYVDLVPAVKQNGISVERAANKICALTEFRGEVLLTGSYLYVNSCFPNITFTETEFRFMKNVLSKHHVKVYRILKYLINGHGDDEALKSYMHEVHAAEKSFKLYTSYRIKIMMIYHHYQCTNVDQANIGPCVLKVLDDMSKYSDIDSFPKLVDKIDAFENNRVDVKSWQVFFHNGIWHGI